MSGCGEKPEARRFKLHNKTSLYNTIRQNHYTRIRHNTKNTLPEAITSQESQWSVKMQASSGKSPRPDSFLKMEAPWSHDCGTSSGRGYVTVSHSVFNYRHKWVVMFQTALFRYSKTVSLSSERENRIILVCGLLNYETGCFWLILIQTMSKKKTRYDFRNRHPEISLKITL